MIVQIRDRDALSSLPIANLRAYLGSRDWSDQGRWGERSATIFVKECDGRAWEIIVPHQETVAGYAEGMAEAVTVLAAVEERSQLDVFADLAGIDAASDGKDVTASDAYLDNAEYLSELGGIYSITEAALYLKAPHHVETLYPITQRTLRSWIRQRCAADEEDEFPVVFENLIAMRLIAALRSAGVSQRGISESEFLMQEETGLEHPMAAETLWGGEGQGFAELRRCLMDAGSRGQAALGLVQKHLIPAQDLVFDESSGQAISWEPQPGIVLDPLVQFGAPCIKGTRIPTAALAGMVSAGDSPESTARAYRISTDDVGAACDWERRIHSR